MFYPVGNDFIKNLPEDLYDYCKSSSPICF